VECDVKSAFDLTRIAALRNSEITRFTIREKKRGIRIAVKKDQIPWRKKGPF